MRLLDRLVPLVATSTAYVLGARAAMRRTLRCAWCGRTICEYRYLAHEAGWRLMFVHALVCDDARAVLEVVVDWVRLRLDAEARGWTGGPHCDADILHAPGACDACDAYPDHQRARERDNVNFTGQHDGDKIMCPSEARRFLADIEQWPRNRPVTS